MHKKKVEEVRDWLKRADASLQLGLTPTPRMLVLSGPTGSGKSAMLQVLAQELQFEVCEWLEPRSEAFNLPFQPGMEPSAPYESRMKQFATFLQSSLRTLSLCVGPSASNAAATPSQGMRRRLVLLDELPNTAGGGERSAELARQLHVGVGGLALSYFYILVDDARGGRRVQDEVLPRGRRHECGGRCEREAEEATHRLKCCSVSLSLFGHGSCRAS